MKYFTMSMFASREDLLEEKIAYYEQLLQEHKKIFTWVKNNPGCHPENIRYEILRLLEELENE